MHHIDKFFRSASFDSAASGGGDAGAGSTAELTPHLAALGLGRDTPIAVILEARDNESKSTWQQRLRAEFDLYLGVVYASNAEFLSLQLDRTEWSRFKRDVTLATAFTNKLWKSCDPLAQRTANLVLMGKPAVASKTFQDAKKSALAAPKTAAAECMDVLCREEEPALEGIRFMFRETRVRPAMTCDRILASAVTALTSEEIPSPFVTTHAVTRLKETAPEIVARIKTFIVRMEEQSTGGDTIRLVIAHCNDRIASMTAKHGGEFKLHPDTPAAAIWALQRFAFDKALDALRVTQTAYESIPAPPRCLESTELAHIESRRRFLSRDIRHLSDQRGEKLAAIAGIDAEATSAARTKAYNDAMHRDLVTFLRQITRLCEEFLASHMNDHLAVGEALAFLHKTLDSVRVTKFDNVQHVVSTEDGCISIDSVQPVLDSCATCLRMWQDRVAADAASSASATFATTDVSAWFKPWMDVTLSAESVDGLQRDLAFTVTKAKTLLLAEPLTHRQCVATLTAGMHLLTDKEAASRTVTVVALIQRLIPWADVFYTLDFIEPSVSRKRKG